MEVGLLTASFADVDEAIEAGLATGVRRLELAHREVDRVRDAGLEVAALARYGEWARLAPSIRLAAEKGVPAVSTLSGLPDDPKRCGVIDWTEFAALYDGFVSIEHEDDDYAPAEGMTFAVEHLR